ncbi:MAG: MFS transporter [Firmicutes bacterium]|nr:MFS transporter [Bacillota bacterium]
MLGKKQKNPVQALPPLWTRNFTIITLGTVVSMLGGAIGSFAISLLVLEYTGSAFLYAVFIALYYAPKLIMPLLAGSYLDNFSRRKVIYTLDFCNSAVFLLLFFLMRLEVLSFPLLALFAVLIGSIESSYTVAYDSFYPTLVAEGNYRRAYSISSLIHPLATIMMPVAAALYNSIGIAPLFLFNSAAFLIAACFETQIKAEEKHLLREKTKEKMGHQYLHDLREGCRYIAGEKGLLVITCFFFFIMMPFAAQQVLLLPWFKAQPELGVFKYSLVMGAMVSGRLLGGLLHYRFEYPAEKKMSIAIFVYITSAILDGTFLFLPLIGMLLFCFLTGLLAVTSYSIRISSTQAYVPNDYRGRFNGVFQMVNNAGSIIGNLAAGALAELFSPRIVLLGFMCLSLLATFSIMIPNRQKVKPVFNRRT